MFWVKAAQLTALNNAINTANAAKTTVQNNSAASAAASALDTATAAFIQAKKFGSKIRVNTAVIDSAITAANSAKAGIVTSSNGLDVDPANQWVTASQMEALDNAIQTATQAKSNVQTNDAANAAAGALDTAVSLFNSQKAYGLKPVVNKSELSFSINSAKSLKGTASVSADGTDIAIGQNWVTSEIMSTFTTAISTAESIHVSTSATQTDVDNAVSALNSAMTTFSDARQPGSKI